MSPRRRKSPHQRKSCEMEPREMVIHAFGNSLKAYLASKVVVPSPPPAEAPANAMAGEKEVVDVHTSNTETEMETEMGAPLYTTPPEDITLRELHGLLGGKFPSGYSMRVIGDGNILELHIISHAEKIAAVQEGGFQTTLPILVQEQQLRQQRKKKKRLSCKTLIRGLPWAATTTEVQQALQDAGITQAQVRLHQRTNKKRPPLFIAAVAPGDRDKIMGLQKILEVPISIELLPPHLDPPPQCFRCQRPGHVAKYCRETSPACAKCAGPHESRNCTQKEPRRCVNCGGEHVASWRGCRILATAIAVKKPRKRRARQHGAKEGGEGARPPHREQPTPSHQPRANQSAAERGKLRPQSVPRCQLCANQGAAESDWSHRAPTTGCRENDLPKPASGRHSSATSRAVRDEGSFAQLTAVITRAVSDAVSKAIMSALPTILEAWKTMPPMPSPEDGKEEVTSRNNK